MSKGSLRLRTITTFALCFIMCVSLAALGARNLTSMDSTDFKPSEFEWLRDHSDIQDRDLMGQPFLIQRDASFKGVKEEDLQKCRNRVVQATISSLEKQDPTKLYLPRHAIKRYGAGLGRDYPYSITIKPDCLTLKMTDKCRQSTKTITFRDSKTSPEQIRRLLAANFMVPVSSDFDGLHAYTFSEEKVREVLHKGELKQSIYEAIVRGKTRNLDFVNFTSDVNSETTPTIYMRCDYQRRKSYTPCSTNVGGPWKLVSLQVTSREVLFDWQLYIDQTVEIMKTISNEGVFYDDCRKSILR